LTSQSGCETRRQRCRAEEGIEASLRGQVQSFSEPGMKRTRSSLTYFDSSEFGKGDYKRHDAETRDGSEFYEDEVASPLSPVLSRLGDALSTPKPLQPPSVPLDIPRPSIGVDFSRPVQSPMASSTWESSVCCTPEELKSPALHQPPPRPNKLSPGDAPSPQLVHPQPSLKSVPLQDLLTKIGLRPCTYLFRLFPSSFPVLWQIDAYFSSHVQCLIAFLGIASETGTLRRIVGSASAKVANRPKPQLQRTQTDSHVHVSREYPSQKEDLPNSSGPKTDVPRKSRHGADASLRFFLSHATQEQETSQREDKRGTTHRLFEAKGNRSRGGITVDPSTGTGMFHRATLSKLCTRAGTAVEPLPNEEWAEGRRYDPYELVRTQKASSASKPSPSHLPPSSSTIPTGIPSSFANVGLPTHTKQVEQVDNTECSSVPSPSPSPTPSPWNRCYSLPFDCSSDDDELGRFSPTFAALDREMTNRRKLHATRRDIGNLQDEGVASISSASTELLHQHSMDVTGSVGGPAVYVDDPTPMAEQGNDAYGGEHATTPREHQIFTLEMDTEAEPSHYVRLLREPGPIAW